jgi:hypothetical protein
MVVPGGNLPGLFTGRERLLLQGSNVMDKNMEEFLRGWLGGIVTAAEENRLTAVKTLHSEK